MYPLPLSCYGYENLLLFYSYFIDYFFFIVEWGFLETRIPQPCEIQILLVGI